MEKTITIFSPCCGQKFTLYYDVMEQKQTVVQEMQPPHYKRKTGKLLGRPKVRVKPERTSGISVKIKSLFEKHPGKKFTFRDVINGIGVKNSGSSVSSFLHQYAESGYLKKEKSEDQIGLNGKPLFVYYRIVEPWV